VGPCKWTLSGQYVKGVVGILQLFGLQRGGGAVVDGGAVVGQAVNRLTLTCFWFAVH